MNLLFTSTTSTCLLYTSSGQTQKIQLHYFTATFYKTGTCHLEFTNTDVLKSFNLYAGQRKRWLPPTYGKKSYHDMAAADRRVVDSYEGDVYKRQRLALAVLHPGRFWTFAGGVRFST